MRVKELREAKGWSVRALADRAGMSFAAVHRIESSKVWPEYGSLEKLAKALGVKVPDLLAGRGN